MLQNNNRPTTVGTALLGVKNAAKIM